MVVATVNYGNFNTHSGTIVEVATVLKGKGIKNTQFFYNGTNVTAIEYL